MAVSQYIHVSFPCLSQPSFMFAVGTDSTGIKLSLTFVSTSEDLHPFVVLVAMFL